MIEDVFNFLTGGVFNSLSDLLNKLLESIIILITNMAHFMFDPIINKILALVPIIEDFSSNLQFIFNFVKPYISFILDISFISTPVLAYLILSIIFRITIKLYTYVSKVILKWYHQLAP